MHDMGAIHCSTYCNFWHRVRDGKPIEHECRIISPAALKAEMYGNYKLAIELMQSKPARGRGPGPLA